MAKKRKLTREELEAENEKMREEIRAQDYGTTSSQVVDMLSGKNWIVYILCTFLPPVGLWYMWRKQDRHSVRGPQMYVWSGVAVIITVVMVKDYIWPWISGMIG